MNEFTILREYGPDAPPPSEDALANARAALMTELRAEPDAAKPRRRVWFNLRVAAAVAAVVAIGLGLVLATGQPGGTGSEQAEDTPAGVRLVAFEGPALPPELGTVPDGLHSIGLSGEPGQLGRGYAPAVADSHDFVDVRVSRHGHPRNTTTEFRETTYDGQQAFIGEAEATNAIDPSQTLRTVHLSWRTGADTWTNLSGSGRFATEESVRALADTLVPATDKIDLSIDVAPAGWELVAFKDGVTTLHDPAAPDRDLTVSLRTGLVEDFAEGTEVPVKRHTPVTINGGPGDLLELTNGAWMLQALLPDGRAFLLQVSSGFTEEQVIEVAEGVHA